MLSQRHPEQGCLGPTALQNFKEMSFAILTIPAILPSCALASRREPVGSGNGDRGKAGPRTTSRLMPPLEKHNSLVTSSQRTDGLHERGCCLTGCQKYLASSEFWR